MNKRHLKAIWLGVMLGLLTVTYPSWSNPANQKMSGYDAPWIYPALNPAAERQ